MPKGFFLDDDLGQRVIAAVKWVEAQYRNPAAKRRRYPLGAGSGGTAVQFIRVTGAATADGGVNYYPGMVRDFDIDAGTWGDRNDSDVWLIQVIDEPLTTDGDAVYMAKLLGETTVDDDTHPLYATSEYPAVVDVECVDGDIEITKAN